MTDAPAQLAAAPIVIGELSDVPAPGSPVASQWSQEVTRRAVHRFPDVATRDAKYPAAAAGVGAVCTVAGVAYWSNGTAWAGPLGITSNIVTPFPFGSGAYRNVLWPAQAVGGITIDITGNITLAAGIGGLWLLSWSAFGDAAASGIVESRVLFYPAAGGVVVMAMPTGPAGSGGLGGACTVRVLPAGGYFQVQTIHGVSRNCASGTLQLDRVSL